MMNDTLERIQKLVEQGNVKISNHGYDELADDDILAGDAIEGLQEATLLEDYPDYYKGPCVLLLQRDTQGEPMHIVWGIPKDEEHWAVLVTAYRPDPDRWTDDFTRRLP